MSLPELGQKVSYVRVSPDGEAIYGVGIVHALILSPDKRPQVQVHSVDGKYNIDAPAIDVNYEEAAAYVLHVLSVRKRADEVNAEIKEIAKAGNDEIELMNHRYMGAPIDVSHLDDNTEVNNTVN